VFCTDRRTNSITLVGIIFLPEIIPIDFRWGTGSQNRTCESNVDITFRVGDTS
jgi:hypothetical protein